jgi:predicted  nucleic acid-binding Zn-ribbon protein
MRQLFDLHELDVSLDQCRTELESVEARLADGTALANARAVKSKLEETGKTLLRRHISGSQLVDELQDKAKALDRRLYGGSIRNPHELESLQAESTYANNQTKEAEDQVLELMIGLDENEAALARSTEKLDEMEQTWVQTQAALSKDRTSLTSRIQQLSITRREIVSAIAAPTLAQYERVLQTHQQGAMAKVERGMCTGCRLTIPTGEQQRVRAARELITCSSCGRILVAD